MLGLLWFACLSFFSGPSAAAQEKSWNDTEDYGVPKATDWNQSSDPCVRFVDGRTSCDKAGAPPDTPEEARRRNALHEIEDGEREIGKGKRDQEMGKKLYQQGLRTAGNDGERLVAQGQALIKTGEYEILQGQNVVRRARTIPFDEAQEEKREIEQSGKFRKMGAADAAQGARDKARGQKLIDDGKRIGGVYGEDLQIEGRKLERRGQAQMDFGQREAGRWRGKRATRIGGGSYRRSIDDDSDESLGWHRSSFRGARGSSNAASSGAGRSEARPAAAQPLRVNSSQIIPGGGISFQSGDEH